MFLVAQLSVEAVFILCIIFNIAAYKFAEYIQRPDYIRGGNVEVFLEPIKDKPIEQPKKTKFASLSDSHSKILLSRKEIICLATNIYQEAKFENHTGKIAVAHVTYNRLKSGKWGTNICSVVYSKSQFSWTLSNKLREEIPSGRYWDKSLYAAKEFMNGKRIRLLENSEFYHADYIRKPKWAFTMEEKTKIGHHIFYVQNEEN